MNSKWIPIGLLATAAVFFAGCGFRLTPFFTPVYKNPPGYSETYKKHLLGEPPDTQAHPSSQEEGSQENAFPSPDLPQDAPLTLDDLTEEDPLSLKK